jgi:hypothetical protein
LVPGIVHHPSLTCEEKRGVLADWASDLRALPDHPALRRLDDGSMVRIDDVLDGLKLLDGLNADVNSRGAIASDRRGRRSGLSRIWKRGHDDDDDDPPPAPASIQPRLPTLDGSLAAAA